MTNYLVPVTVAAALFAGVCLAADAVPRYVQAPAGSTLAFTFTQEGAASKGSFTQFTTALGFDEKSPASGSLKVEVQIASIDTQDKDRNEMLAGADLFDTQKHPTARYVADSFARRANGDLEAVGKLTLRGVTHDLRLPLKISRNATGLTLSGETSIRRLDYGVGQGDWKSTESVGDEVKVQYQVSLVRAK